MVKGDRSMEQADSRVNLRGDEQEGKYDGGNRNTMTPFNVATPARAGGRWRDSNNQSAARGPTSSLEELMRRKGVDEAWNALDEMQRRGTMTDKFTVSRMLMKTVGDGRCRLNPARVYRSISLVERFIKMQPQDVDEVLFNALLDTCCRLKDLPRLEATVQRMRELNVSPSPVTLGILVKTYGQAGDLQKVLQVWSEMEKQRGQANAVTYGCMIDACVKCGHLEKADEIFRDMRKAGKHRNTILYTTLIKGYGLEKDLDKALELFREMPHEGVPYNTITYNSIIDACIKCNELPMAEQLLREMTAADNPVKPDLITFSTLLKGYCHIGELDKALQVAEEIKARGLRCDELVYNTLMDGCVKASDITAGVGLFEEMIHQGLRPSAITHSIIARLYQHAGYDEDATEAVAQLYQHHGLERPSNNKSFNRKTGAGQSSPGSASGRVGNRSAVGSPSALAMPHLMRDQSDSSWSNASWGEAPPLPGMGQFSETSAPSTPQTASPMPSCGPFLPVEALLGGQAPPLPGDGTPYSCASNSCTSGQPSPFSACPSPTGSPTGMLDGSPHCQHPTMHPAAATVQSTMPPQPMSVPPWPFTCNGATGPTTALTSTEGSLQHVVAVPVMQNTGQAPQQPTMGCGGMQTLGIQQQQGPTGPTSIEASLQQVVAVPVMQNTALGPQQSAMGCSGMQTLGIQQQQGAMGPAWPQNRQSEAQQTQQGPCPMPPPNDVNWSCQNVIAPGQISAYFENWAPDLPGPMNNCSVPLFGMSMVGNGSNGFPL